MNYLGDAADAVDNWGKIGVLLVNLGSPEAPTAAALKPYLKEFLWDPRVVEMSRPLWWLILNGIILRTRPAKSAHAYQSVWTEQGAPLLVISRAQTQAISGRLQQQWGDKVVCQLAMRYGQPSVAHGLASLKKAGVGRVLVLPLYPQYSASTVASVHDAVFTELQRWRRMPEIRTVNEYHVHPGYISALASSIREHWQQHGRAKRLLFSFHGMPQRYVDNGDPYRTHCEATAKATANQLGLQSDEWQVSYQSRFGKEEWLRPYTDETLIRWGKEGLESVEVVCPGFSADCLETIEEINVENRQHFIGHGGLQFHYIPALNDREDHVQALCDVIARNVSGWI
ncbi:MAG: ferrochelatase [Gammaproteobacteria bacterium]|nr:ferrochelatase [Gammaproteobacteria bacterium]